MFSVKKSNLFHLISIIMILLGSVFVVLFYTFFPNILRITGGQLVQIAFIQVLFVFVPVLIYYLSFGKSFTHSLLIKKIRPLNLFLSFLAVLFMIPLTSLASLISQLFVNNATQNLLLEISYYPFGLSLLVIAIFPAIFEELSTRLILLDNYRNQKFYISCLFSGLFFGFLHLNLNQFSYAFILGFFFAFIVQVTGSIFSSILMHFVLNSFSLSMVYISAFLTENVNSASIESNVLLSQTDFIIPIIIYSMLTLVTLPLLLLILYLMLRVNNKLHLFKKNTTSYELITGRRVLVPNDYDYGQVNQAQWGYQQETSLPPLSPVPKENPWKSIFFWISLLIFVSHSILNEIIVPMMNNF